MPATSEPGTKGRSGLTWYSPRVCSTSGNDTPAASTSTTTPLSGVMKWEVPGSATSSETWSADSGPDRSVICIALICASASQLRPQRVDRPAQVGNLALDLLHPVVQLG